MREAPPRQWRLCDGCYSRLGSAVVTTHVGRNDEEAAEAQDFTGVKFLFHTERLAGVGRTPQVRQFALREQVADLAVERFGQGQGDAHVGLVRLATSLDAADGGHRDV